VKGIVLAGGTGSRLFPLTKITNKHLLPIYDKPMIYYPIQTLVDAGIEDILLVTGGRNSGDFLRLLANGKQFGLKHINYTYQEGEGGIADALALAEHFADGNKICVVLGDNIIEGNIKANFPARLSFKLPSDADSRTVLDSGGANHLLTPGDMLFSNPNRPGLARIHAPVASIEDIKAAVEYSTRRLE